MTDKDFYLMYSGLVANQGLILMFMSDLYPDLKDRKKVLEYAQKMMNHATEVRKGGRNDLS